MSDIAVAIGNNIREYRIAKILSQQELAHRSGLHTSHLGQIERGEKSPTLDSLHKIVSALDITFQELFDFDISHKITKESYTHKIVGYLNAMSEDEQQDVYKMVKVLMRWKTKNKH